MTIGEKLKSLRVKNGLTCEALAWEAKVPAMSVYRYERGHAAPTLFSLNRLCRVLKVTLVEFQGCELPEDGRTLAAAK